MSDKVQFVITGQRVYSAHGFGPLAIAVDHGTIVAITTPDNAPPAHTVYEAGDKPVLPGIIDPHTHMREPGNPHKEDWLNGTQAAAAGGITCVLEHPNAIPPVNNAENFRYKQKIAAEKAVIDFGLYGGAGDGTISQMAEQAAAGAVAFKTFLWPYTDRGSECDGIYTIDDGVLYQIFEQAAALGLPSCIHAENYRLVQMFTARLIQAGRRGPLDHQAGRPVITEAETIWRAMQLAQAAGAHLHILHVSSGAGATAIKQWREMGGQNVTAETCPPYLTFSEDRLTQVGPSAKINPPLRPANEQTGLWERVADGTINTIGSDHAPHHFEAKEKGRQDMHAAAAGAPGVETSLPVMLTHVNAGRLSLERLVKLMSENVARLYGLYPRKGAISIGSDGDFTVVDLKRRTRIDPEKLRVKEPRTARMFEGFETTAQPVLTVVRGQIVMQDGEVVGQPGDGQFIPRLVAKEIL